MLRQLESQRSWKLLVNVCDLGLLAQPEIGVGKGAEILNGFALLLDPRVVLLVVPTDSAPLAFCQFT
jgi:hypothetical protein